MNSEKWQKVKVIFNQAVEMPTLERNEFIAKECEDDEEMRLELEKMLAFAEEDEEHDTLEDNAFSYITTENTSLPEKIGNYKIIKEIGRGGMGAVYEARRETDNFKQKVALKVIKRGMDTDAILSRFRHEQQILSSLEHPFISRFLDGGMTEEGLPFYAMEYVEGTDIDVYCRENNLSIEERLKLFRQVCSAVQYAHQNFIAHRDLKPNNILVTKDGTPKLLDFGIAKVLSDAADDKTGTATQLGMMTPAYASPEQVRGEKVGVQSDIYSLGVILYELLTGRKPYYFKVNRVEEAIRVICESEPLRPSATQGNKNGETLKENAPKFQTPNRKSLRGDLDNIILKALKKEPMRRYASVEQFSEDIRRHLEGLPVTARPDTLGYRVSKFIQRNRATAIAASIIFLALVGGILATTYQARIAQIERARAEKRFEQVRKLANNVVFKYHDAISTLPGSTAAREMLVKDAVEYLDNLTQDAGDNAQLQHELANAYLQVGRLQGSSYFANLGESDESLKSYSKSIEIFEQLLQKEPKNIEYLRNYEVALDQKVLLLNRLNNWREAEETANKLLEINQRLIDLEPDNPAFKINRTRAFNSMGDAVNFAGGHLASAEWYRRSLESAEKLIAENPTDEQARRNVVVPLQRIGTKNEYQAEILKELKESPEQIKALYIEAEKVHRRSYELALQLQRDFPNNQIYERYLSAIKINLGTALARIGKGEEGIPLIMSSLDEFRKTVKTDAENSEAKRDVAECLQYLAFARDAMNQPDAAIEANRESLKILEEITIKDPTNFEFLSQAHLTYNNTGDIFLKKGNLAEALDFYQKGMEYVEKMSKLNQSPQIAILRSESNRKIGEAYSAMAEKNKNAEMYQKAEEFLTKAKDLLTELKNKNELGKIYEHKLMIAERDLNLIP
jgi:serine/threonine protein kinase/tetratricopeptide (TPR) repeat protein